MADNTFSSLSQNYKKFLDCAAKIVIDGTDIEENVGAVRNVTVELTALYEASTCCFDIYEGLVYKDELVQFSDLMRKTLKLGSIVEVQLGYGGYDKGKFKKVFKGYIDSIEMRFTQEEGCVVTVECLDAKGIMMNNYKSEIKKDINTYSDAVEKVFKSYSSIANKRSVTGTSEITVPIEQHNESDYEFAVRLAKKVNFGFYIINGEIFFEPAGSQSDELIEIEAGEFLFEFSMRKTVEKMVSKVIARNNNEQEPQKTFEATVDSYSELGGGSVSPTDITKLLSDAVTRTVIDPAINSNEDAKTVAEAALTRLSLNVAQGHVKFIGVPDIHPGKYLSIKGFGTEYDKKYFITKVKHDMSTGGYFTTCTLGGNKA